MQLIAISVIAFVEYDKTNCLFHSTDVT